MISLQFTLQMFTYRTKNTGHFSLHDSAVGAISQISVKKYIQNHRNASRE